MDTILAFFVNIWNEVKGWVSHAYDSVKVLVKTVIQAVILGVNDLAGHRKKIDYVVLGLAYLIIREGNVIASAMAYLALCIYFGFRLANYDIQPALTTQQTLPAAPQVVAPLKNTP